ncbi:MAG TPA: hypothetical protein VFN16_07345 [Saccharospirillum sp.]|nr:hypothetical protein [Saccharospirillum sp.]
MVSVRNVLLGLVTLACSIPLHAQETVRIAVGELSENALHYGVAAHIVEEAFQASGMDVEVDFLPWARVLVYVESGQYDASILWVKTR